MMRINWSTNPSHMDEITCEYLLKSNLVPVMVPVHTQHGVIMEERMENPNKKKPSLRERAAAKKAALAAQQAAIEEQNKKLAAAKEALSKRYVAPTKTTQYSLITRASPVATSQLQVFHKLGYDADKATEEISAKAPRGIRLYAAHGPNGLITNNSSKYKIPTLDEMKKSPYGKWKNKLTDSEKSISTQFLDKYAGTVNQFLQGQGQPMMTKTPSDKAISSITNIVNTMDKVIDKFELPESITVITSLNVPRGMTYSQLFPNGMMTNPGYTMATATSSKYTPTMSSSDGAETNPRTHIKLLMKVVVPAGKGTGAYMAPLSSDVSKCQVVLPRGTQFKIDTLSLPKDALRPNVHVQQDIVTITVHAIGKSVANIEDVKKEQLEQLSIHQKFLE